MKHILLFILAAFSLQAQVPQSGLTFWLRADSLVTVNAQNQLTAWKNIIDQRAALVPAGSSAVTIAPVNGRAAMVLDGAGYIEAPSLMPVGEDYTLVVVAKLNNVGATNNIVSGENRALYCGGTVFPRMLHNGNFSQQSVSTVGLDGLSIVRLRFNNTSGIARIAINNKEGAADPIPSNTDSVIYLGAYQRGNLYSGQIAEVLVYKRELQGADLVALDTYLHARYAVPRVPDPPPPMIAFDVLPQSLLVAKCNDSLFVKGTVLSSRVKGVNIIVDTNGVVVTSKNISTPTVGTQFSAGFVVEQGQHLYNIVVTVDTDGVQRDTVVNNRGITCGEVITITGQSNSIFGAPGINPSQWARTYGSNASSNRSDTAYKPSSAAGSGGGPDVGAFGLYMQNRIADDMKTPTLVINGGVGGTRIEQHLPDPNNRMNLGTIYGSWLYRVTTSGSKERIRWLFWYQGESNGDDDDYLSLFDQLRTAWHEDLPNLQNIVVVQIRPGCGPDGHEKIRDMQRKLEYRHPDVIVHAASGLPFHDGCHYGTDGYVTLGEQLYNIYKINELAVPPGKYSTSPTITAATCVDKPCNNVRLMFKRADRLRMTPDVSIGGFMRTARDAFYANSDPTMLPLAVNVTDDAVELQFASPVSRVTYIPAKNYSTNPTTYEGPWLVTERGVGVITFNNVDVQPLSVAEEEIVAEELGIGQWEQGNVIVDLRGRVVASSKEEIQRLPSGVYVARVAGRTAKMVVVQ
ncbi:MAG: hypothetical protein NTX15_01610 [Candidatus Kapabacteria bacterium]|nr:hypothetical protein [Candidatus Kapabacteria bacterium]